MSRVVIVGQGPAAYLMATLLLDRGEQVTLVAESQGSWALWPGQWDFRNYAENTRTPVDDPWHWWAAHGAGSEVFWTRAEWVRAWKTLATIWNGIGMTVEVPWRNRWTLSPLGHPKPIFLAPPWQYATAEWKAVSVVGLPHFYDFDPETVCWQYRQATHMPCRPVMLPAPPHWSSRWTALRWAQFLDQPEGQQWLYEEIAKVFDAGSDWLFPQVLGRDQVDRVIEGFALRFGQRPYEIGLVPPCLGGLRIQRRWQRELTRRGANWVPGRVVAWDAPQTVRLASGERLSSDWVVWATGGVLGGGITVLPDGRLKDLATGREWGLGCDRQHAGYGGDDPDVVAVGRQRSGWDPDQHGDGGALVLYSCFQALLRQQGQVPRREGRG
jgi:glycerol-3-phosphate dehydrogenase subunit B